MRWTDFLERRERRAMDASGAAVELGRGEAAGAASLLCPWRFASHPDLLGVMMDALRATESQPAHRWRALPFAPRSAFKVPKVDDLPEFYHRREAGWGLTARSAVDPLAWTLESLAFFAEEVDLRERAAFTTRTFATRPDRDDACRKLWAEWFRTGFADRDRWTRLFAGPVHEAAKTALLARKYPSSVRDRLLGSAPSAESELSELAYDQLLFAPSDLPGWVDVATRVVETGGANPVDALVGSLDPAGLLVAGHCAARRGHWADTAALLAEDCDLDRRGDRVRDQVSRDPAWAHGLVDLHTALRLLTMWALPNSGDPDDAWVSIRSNRGRARGRLRAVLARGSRDRLRDGVHSVPGLHARTSQALSRHVYRWFMDNDNQDSPPSPGQLATPLCASVSLVPFAAEDVPAARTWTLLVVLRGQLDRLERWVRSGSTGDRDTRWGELLATALPPALRDPGRPSDAEGGHRRLRSWLAAELGMQLERELPRLAAIARLPPDAAKMPGLRLLQREWDARVPLPSGGFPAIVEAARLALAKLGRADAEELT